MRVDGVVSINQINHSIERRKKNNKFCLYFRIQLNEIEMHIKRQLLIREKFTKSKSRVFKINSYKCGLRVERFKSSK